MKLVRWRLDSVRVSIWFALAAGCSACSLIVDTSALSSSASDGDAGAPDVPRDASADGVAPTDASADVGSDGASRDARVIPPGASQWSSGPAANGHFYEVVVAPAATWRIARDAAVLRGGHLATATSKEENDFLVALATATPAAFKNNFGPWLGGFQPAGSPEPAGGWQWVTGEAFGFTNWEPTEPSNSNGENVLGFYKTPLWGDYEDSIAYGNGYIVEYE